MKKPKPFVEQQKNKATQLVLLLGPGGGGKTELLHALKNMKKVSKSTLATIIMDHDSPKFQKVEAAATHSAGTTVDVNLESETIKLFKSKLICRDGSGLECDRITRIEGFVDKFVAKKPKKWEKGVICLMVFDSNDVLANAQAPIMEFESCYRDLIETWIQKLYPDSDADEAAKSIADKMRNKKVMTKQTAFRPPLSVIFVGTHEDIAEARGENDIRVRIAAFVKRVIHSAEDAIPFPKDFRVETGLVVADVKTTLGRLKFLQEFYQQRARVTGEMIMAVPS